MQLDRRAVLALLGVGVAPRKLLLAQQHVHQLRKEPASYKLQFFTAAENKIIDQVASMIVPADSHSGGAGEANVSYYIDLIATHSAKDNQSKWKARIHAFDMLARTKYRGAFVDLLPDQRASLLNEVAAQEANPQTPAELFFVDMKKSTIAAYYTSEIGLRNELGYKGGQALSSFPGCVSPPNRPA